ncbi:hypothetical protein C8F04DRAFT_1073868 [Mycena alexandri]|uniref:SET domain-containing protein n=1 Tax=Mycena alexandri TaxID=1745969 RepID=A0AAD6TBK7_9AGAR|nr:hypothetical protein C8F04DRAFT_1073868 [Mycena alexandri]
MAAAKHDAESLQRDRTTAQDVHLQVHAEFHAWKDKMVVDTFKRLGNARTSPFSFAAHAFRMPRAASEPLPTPPPKPEDRDAELLIWEWNYDADGKPDAGRAIPMTVVALPPETFGEHPRYQYCTPASRNENARMLDNKDAPFAPYPEDPAFPRDAYLRTFNDVQWVSDQRDPDAEVVEYETVRRLHIEHGFSAARIDHIMLMSGFTPLRKTNESGLLWAVGQRDLPPVIWGDGLPSSSKPQLPPHFAEEDYPDSNDVFTQVNTGVSKFCPNLNCLTHNCHVHIDADWLSLTPAFALTRPRLTSAELPAAVHGPHPGCGNDCFSLIHENDMEDDGLANVPLDHLAVLGSLFKAVPDASPCDLAVICKMRCRDVFRHRRDTIDDAEIISSPPLTKKKKPKVKKHKLEFWGKDSAITPCVHPGPCSDATLCECFRRKLHCERNCRCAKDCLRRWEGCNSTCRKTRSCRRSSKCKCRLAGRECDPELCVVCDARDTQTHFPDDVPAAAVGGKCTNVALQRGTFKNIVVRKSKYGLGAFAAEDISMGDVLGEYVGELLDNVDERVGHREIIQKHSKLNYCFGMGGVPADKDGKGGAPETTVDAQWLGNPTRFLNDSKPKKPNCVAEEFRVNGELRLAIRALKSVKMGGELTLSYGERYWEQGQEAEKGRSGVAVKTGNHKQRNK